ncbi:MAG: efflux RND transporter periplasmic adaptor subunit, partial [Oricola sp.]
MKVWKQVLVSVALVAVAFVGWAMYYPGAKPVLARYGIDWLGGPPEGAPGQGGQAASGQSSGGQSSGGQGQRGGFSRDALVVTRPATYGTVNDRLTAIGTGQAVRTVSVRALVPGQIAEIPVVSGAHVAAGDVIIRLDAAEEELAVERARLAVDDAQRKFDRTASLLAQRAVSSVEADQAQSELSAARVALRAAELDLSRRTVTAPIAGSLGILSVNAGDYVTSQSDVTTIDDRSQILVEFYVPERFAARMVVGKAISATAIARPGEVFEGEITAVDNRVDEASRTLRVQARIANDQDLLRAGMSFEVMLRFGGETWPSVDPLAIQWDSTGPYVWRVVDGKAERLGIAIIQRNADRVLVKAE